MSEYYTEKMRLELLLKISTDQYDKADHPMNPSKAARHHKETIMLMNKKINEFLDDIEFRERNITQMNKPQIPIIKKSFWQRFKEWIWED